MAVTRSMSRNPRKTISSKRKKPSKGFEEDANGWYLHYPTLADEALEFYAEEVYALEFRKNHPDGPIPVEVHTAEQLKWHQMSRSEQAQWFEKARQKRAEERESYRKWKNRERD